MFKKILIANRGEIAVRIIRTCREMEIETVAVYSEADSAAAHVLEADEAVLLGGSESSESYLNMERIIEAAKQTGSEAIHPGYGFLAENPEFAALCEKNGISFVGPPARVIRHLGDKVLARKTMKEAGVPIIPGMLTGTTDLKVLAQEADKTGYPVLVKAVAGGGGKGMRVVRDPGSLEQACIEARSEAEKAFGNGALYLERCLERPHHVEFQILSDHHGHVVHLFERECSIQRRHQKIIEETPSPSLTPSLREAMGKAAISAARASGYVNAGTVEFMLDRKGGFYFLEVNTRLQVEHPITEMTTGIDLVRKQLEIAAGHPLSLEQEDIIPRGHAIECRIYAEDPEAGFFPSPGPVLLLREPSGPGIRNDCGVYRGFEVPVEYDPILSKLIVAADDREAARRRMIRALETYVILGIKTTIPFLIDLLNSEAFIAGHTDTGFIERYFSNWTQRTEDVHIACAAYLADELELTSTRARSQKAPAGWPTPWQSLGEWRL